MKRTPQMSHLPEIFRSIPLFLSLTSLYTWPCCALSSCGDHTFVFENKFAGTLDKRSLIEKYDNEKQWLGGLKNLSECLPPVESVAASMSSLLHSSLTCTMLAMSPSIFCRYVSSSSSMSVSALFSSGSPPSCGSCLIATKPSSLIGSYLVSIFTEFVFGQDSDFCFCFLIGVMETECESRHSLGVRTLAIEIGDENDRRV